MNAVQEEVLFQREDDMPKAAEAPAVESRNYLIFIISDLKLGVDADYVVEILNDYTITYLPMMPDYILGIYNMRGQIIPILDVRLRLGKSPKEGGDSLVIVLNYKGTQLGILVDSVELMIDIPNHLIRPIPSQNTQKLVSGMCTLPDGAGTMLVLGCDQLMLHG
ncbi:MAG: purine-binding chemotaxis protein CheW [Oscillibacter sp.]|nr:purine-binding chemotaxis protein CheW [Oscillibacter sp.]